MRIVGIDGGIATVGWSLLDLDADAGTLTIVAAGVRTFDAPETAKQRTPTNAVRRLHRGQRLLELSGGHVADLHPVPRRVRSRHRQGGCPAAEAERHDQCAEQHKSLSA